MTSEFDVSHLPAEEAAAHLLVTPSALADLSLADAARVVAYMKPKRFQAGTIVIQGDCVKLTTKGERIASFGRFFRQNLLPKQRLLMGEYTDQLTNPFRRSDPAPDYLCR